MTKRSKKKSQSFNHALVILFFALFLRVLYYQENLQDPLFGFAFVDSKNFDDTAMSFASGRLTFDTPFWKPPGYSIFLGLLYYFVGRDFTVITMAQHILGALSCLLVYFLALRFMPGYYAFMAGLISAFYGVFIYFEGEILYPSLSIFFNLGGLILLHKAVYGASKDIREDFEGTKKGTWLTAGLVFGLSAITRPNILIFLVLVPLLVQLLGVKHRVLVSLLFVLGWLLPIMPITAHNIYFGKDTILISCNTGVNFWVGNNHQSDGKTPPSPGSQWTRLVAEPFKDDPDMKPSAQSRYFYNKTLQDIAQHPLRWAGLMARKLYYLLHGYEIPNNKDIYRVVADKFPLNILIGDSIIYYPFGLIMPLGLIGLVISVKQWRRFVLLYLFAASYAASILAFFVCARYRLSMIPVIIIFAVIALQRTISLAQGGQFKRLLFSIAAPLILLVLLNAPLLGVIRADKMPEHDMLLSMAYLERGDYQKAEAAITEALSKNPSYPDAYFYRGKLLAKHGMLTEAEQAFKKAIALYPEFAAAYSELGNVYMLMGDYAQASMNYIRSLELVPDSAETAFNLGIAYSQVGMLQQSLKAFYNAYRLRPDDPRYNSYLGMAFARLEKTDQALAYGKRAVLLDSQYVEGYLTLGRIYLMAKWLNKAIDAFEKASCLDPDSFEAHQFLAMIYSKKGDIDKAIAELEQALQLSFEASLAVNLAIMLQQQGNVEEALQWLEKIPLDEVDPATGESIQKMMLRLRTKKGGME